MSIAYLDPGNIESDLQSGAVAGFKVSSSFTPAEKQVFFLIVTAIFAVLQMDSRTLWAILDGLAELSLSGPCQAFPVLLSTHYTLTSLPLPLLSGLRLYLHGELTP